ncbi:MAG TPA: hypothetical protein ENN27_02930 [Candidatus Atribacteria bacterium]|nr:hypothetical protein [Candidatus Atribacteria bacterium]
MPIQMLNFPLAEGATYNPYRRSTLEEILGGIEQWTGTMEQIKQQRRQKEILDELLRREVLPSGLQRPFEETLPSGSLPPQFPAAKQPQSLLGRILGAFSPFGEPAGTTPIEAMIAEARIKEMFTSKEAKERALDRIERKIEQGIPLTPQEEKLYYGYTPSENKPEAIVDEFGNIVGYRPKGAVFQPKTSEGKITASDIKELEKSFPAWKKALPAWLPGKQPKEIIKEAREKLIKQKFGEEFTKTKRATLTPQQNQAIINRIQQLRTAGWTDKDIVAALREKGINPATYGLR